EEGLTGRAITGWRVGEAAELPEPCLLTEKVNVSCEIDDLLRGQLNVTRHRGLQIRQTRLDERSDHASVLVCANERRLREIGCAHRRARQIDAVTEMTMVEHVDRPTALERRGRCLEAAGVAFLPRIQSKSHREHRDNGRPDHAAPDTRPGRHDASTRLQYSKQVLTSSTDGLNDPYSYSR